MEQGGVWHPKRAKYWGLRRKEQDMTLLSCQLIQQAAHIEQAEVSTMPDFLTDLTTLFLKGAAQTNSNMESMCVISFFFKEEKWSGFLQ